MARYAVANNKAGVNTANTIMWQLRAPTNRAYVLELGLSVAVAPTTGPEFILYRSLTVGATFTSTTPIAEGSGAVAAADARLDTAWGTLPTVTAAATMRRYAVPNAIGSGVVWTWYDKPLEIEAAATGALVIMNGNATGATLGNLDVYAIIDQ